MYQETLWITTNEYLLRSNLARQTSLTHQFIVLVKQLLYTKTFNAVDERCVLLYVKAEIEKVLFAARNCLTTYTCHYIQQPALEKILDEWEVVEGLISSIGSSLNMILGPAPVTFALGG